MVLTAYFVLSPAIGLSCHRRLRIKSFVRPVGLAKPPRDLTPASRRQDHTILPYASAPFVCAHSDRSQASSARPAISSCADAAASTTSRPASVTIAIRPSWGRDGCGHRADLRETETGIFFTRGLDRANQLDFAGEFFLCAQRESGVDKLRKGVTTPKMRPRAALGLQHPRHVVGSRRGDRPRSH
jgi:hypothetical protein